mmetsp:Transcript_13142/g.11622  ORF Transcript_13142/g.11622 Transcript_13142/m.11622 type:complete len:110 (+) Transcript_13142:130-459(+)
MLRSKNEIKELKKELKQAKTQSNLKETDKSKEKEQIGEIEQLTNENKELREKSQRQKKELSSLNGNVIQLKKNLSQFTKQSLPEEVKDDYDSFISDLKKKTSFDTSGDK